MSREEKDVKPSLAEMYQSTSDPYLIYNLEDRVSRIVQGDTDLETYWRTLHGVWVEIDRCQGRPITHCDKGICQYRDITNQRRLYKFLAGLNSQYEGIRRDILKKSPTPPVDVAYGWVKREATRLEIMPPANPDQTGATNGDSSSSGGVGFGLGDRNERLFPLSASPRTGEQTPHSTAENAAVSGGIAIERSRSSDGDRRIEEVGKAAFAG